jgi:hypothetical protein
MCWAADLCCLLLAVAGSVCIFLALNKYILCLSRVLSNKNLADSKNKKLKL